MTIELKEVLDWFYEGEETRKSLEGFEVIAGDYSYECYEGSAFVLLRNKEGQYFEVNGSHCSCYGLENQWELEEVTEEAIKHRILKGQSYGAFNACEADIRKHFEF